MIRQYELVDRVKAYDKSADEALLNRAYVYAMKMHGSQTRHNGDPYFSHPIEVAGILTALKLDSDTIATALLHDTVEDTSATLDDIEDKFGDEVAALVDGVTKLTRLELASEETRDAENFRKFFIAMSQDVRILLVKLADRLHNMRTLHFHPRSKSRKRIAQETLDIFAPLAGRIGMQDFREELEDLAFAEIFPEARESIINRLSFLTDESDDLIERIKSGVRQVLVDSGVDVEIIGRQKKPFSTWRKLQRKEISFEQLSDLVGFRVVVNSVDECYRTLGVLHQKWKTVPGRFKDYISTPKTNGYQSIHTTVIGPEQQRVEVQIRTRQMHDVAEYGVAAHWAYKERMKLKSKGDGSSEDDPYRALGRLVDMLEHGDSPEEFLEHTKLEMFMDQVFCFTPKGDLIALPIGASPVDFAYAVHTNVGDTCIGTKVNGVTVPLHTRLKNGDSVEILRSSAQKPEPTWEGIAVTGKARSAIRRFVRESERSEFMTLGRDVIQQFFAREQQEFTNKGLEYAAKRLSLENADEVLVQVGQGHITGQDVLTAVYPGIRSRARRARQSLKKAVGLGPNDAPVPIKGLKSGLAVHLGECCYPVPGDRIVGIIDPGKGVKVHTIDCATLETHQETQDQWIDLSWEPKASETVRMTGRIRANLHHEPGALGAMCTRVADYDGNIINIRMTERRTDFFEVIVDIEVDDAKHLTHIIAALRANPLIKSAKRVRGS